MSTEVPMSTAQTKTKANNLKCLNVILSCHSALSHENIAEGEWKWPGQTEQIKREGEEGWDGRQSAMKDMVVAVIFSYQFSEAVIRNISLKTNAINQFKSKKL